MANHSDRMISDVGCGRVADSYYKVATSCRPARISEADEDTNKRSKRLTTDGTDFTDDTDEEGEARVVFLV